MVRQLQGRGLTPIEVSTSAEAGNPAREHQDMSAVLETITLYRSNFVEILQYDCVIIRSGLHYVSDPVDSTTTSLGSLPDPERSLRN